MNEPVIDHRRYLHFPRVGVRSGLSLGRMLLAAVPEDPEPRLLAAAELLGNRVEHLDAQWRTKEGHRPSVDPRPFDHRLDRAWSSVKTSLDRYAHFEVDDPDRRLAAQLHARLFPGGLDFIRRPYVEEHAESQRRITMIESEGLREDLDRLVGERFIDRLLAAHAAYGLALHITEPSGEPSPVSLAAPLRALMKAIADYVLQVLAFAGHDRERNTAPALRALQPIDALRRASARRKARRDGGEGPLDDETLADEMMTEDAQALEERTTAEDSDATVSAA